MVRNPPCWTTSCTVQHPQKNELAPVKLGFSLFWMSQYLQEIWDVSVSDSSSHFGQIWPIHWNITQAKLCLQNANCTETTVEMIVSLYPHGFTDTNEKKTQHKFLRLATWELKWLILYCKYCGRFCLRVVLLGIVLIKYHSASLPQVYNGELRTFAPIATAHL